MQNYFPQQRPYIKFQNSQLIEETFIAHLNGDTLKLEDIKYELSFRNRQVAQSLLKGIELLVEQ